MYTDFFVESHLKNYELAVGKSSPDDILIRLRTDAILLHVLSALKIEKEAKIGGKSCALSVLESLRLDFQQVISVPFGKNHSPHRIVDYILWYGNMEDLETNLVIVRRKADDIPIQLTLTIMGLSSNPEPYKNY